MHLGWGVATLMNVVAVAPKGVVVAFAQPYDYGVDVVDIGLSLKDGEVCPAPSVSPRCAVSLPLSIFETCKKFLSPSLTYEETVLDESLGLLRRTLEPRVFRPIE
jgi:hypothetical protein